MDRYLEEKEKKPKDIQSLDPNEKIKEFMHHVEQHNEIPSGKNKMVRFSDKVQMGNWFHNAIKSKLSKDSDIYQQLSQNRIIKEEMDRYLEEKEKKPKDIQSLDPNEKIKEFMHHVEQHNEIPSSTNKTVRFSDKVQMGNWFHHTIKKKLSKDSDIYRQLSKNRIIKEEMDRYIEEKEKK